MNFSRGKGRSATLDPDVPAPTTESAAVVVSRRRGLPNRRAVAGGFLVALAAIGVFIAARGSDARTRHRVAVATHDLPAGVTIDEADLRFDTVELDDALTTQLFADDEAPAAIGRTTAAGVGAGDVVARSAILDPGARDPRPQLSLPIERARALDGLLDPGQTVDLLGTFAQDGGQTIVVARNAEVLRVDDGPRSALNPSSEVTLVVAVASPAEAIAVVHASQTGKVTVVRSGAEAGPDRYRPPTPTGAN
jgi:Flp pilus assembly protein CpaB